MSRVRAAAALSTLEDTGTAVHDAAGRVADQLGVPPDLAIVLFTPHHREQTDVVSAAVRVRLDAAHVLGSTGEWVIGEGREIEYGPAVAVWGASLPGVTLESFHSSLVRTDRGTGFAGFPVVSDDARAVLLLADPFSYPAHALLRAAGERHPGLPFVGGMASGGTEPGDHGLLIGDDVHTAGAVGVVIGGDVPFRALVSQGCRPIGEPWVVTAAEGPRIQEIGGRPAIERLQETVHGLDERDRDLARRGLHVGIVIDEQRDEFARGDFLIRGLTGADPDTGAISAGELVPVGRTVQFHVRDADTADEDLRELLESVEHEPAGGLLFTCNGRGSRLFGEPGHDAQALGKRFGDLPVAGMSCQGEIGPVGSTSFLHGFTASVALVG